MMNTRRAQGLIFRWHTCGHDDKQPLHSHWLEWMRSQTPACPFKVLSCHHAAREGHLDALKCLRALSPPCPWNACTFCFAVERGHLNILQWLKTQDPCPLQEPFTNTHWCSAAAAGGHVNVMQWLREQYPSCQLPSTCTEAARGGHLNMLQWLRSQDPPAPWNESTSCSAANAAARGGYLHILQWMRAQDRGIAILVIMQLTLDTWIFWNGWQLKTHHVHIKMH
jgi:hypothetical protein